MRMLLNVKIPNEDFNDAVREGTADETISKILEASKPEAVYFTEVEGSRAVVLVVEVDSPSRVPALAEPWFLEFDADVEFRVCMTPEDLAKANLDDLGTKWSE